MKEKNDNQSRRTFLKAGTVAAASSIIAIKASAAPESKEANSVAGNRAALPEAPVTLGHKITSSPSLDDVGTNTITIAEYPISGTDITTPLNNAISFLSNGGQILIPRGLWTSSGGHSITNSISIEGAGFNINQNIYGTEIKMIGTSSFDHMFKIAPPLITDPNTNQVLINRWSNISLKNLGINLENKTSATGLLMTNANGGSAIYATAVENVGFTACAYGIRVNSVSSTQFECILNRFERLSFVGCAKSFSCNSINGGYTFDNCYFYANDNAIALECISIGNLAVNHCLFAGEDGGAANAVILKTTNAYNNISFFDCQDENFEFMYQNGTNFYLEVPIVFRNCLIQSKFKYTATGSVIFDSCWINVTGAANGIIYEDYPPNTPEPNPYIHVYLKGLNNIYKSTSVGKLTGFTRQYSKLIRESVEFGEPYFAPSPPPSSPGYDVTNSSRGVIVIPAGSQSRVVYNNTATQSQSIIFTQLLTYDSGGARVREVARYDGYFIVNLTQNAAADLSIAFKIDF